MVNLDVNSDKKFTHRRLFFVKLPILLAISVLISVLCIFFVKDVSYLSSTFSLPKSGLLGDVFFTFLYFIEQGGDVLVVTIFVLALIHALFADIFYIKRFVRLKKSALISKTKLLFGIILAQVVGVGIFFASFILIFAFSLGASFVFGYFDIKSDLKGSLAGVVSDEAEIVKLIKESPAKIDVYDAAGPAGLVLARRDLKNQPILTVYQGVALPLLAGYLKDGSGNDVYFIPETNRVVYVNFIKDNTDKIIVELVSNHLKYNTNPKIRSIYESVQEPKVTYFNDEEFAVYVKEKKKEMYAKILSDQGQSLLSNKEIVADCQALVVANSKLVSDQESEYQTNCVSSINYSDCVEFRQKIDENKRVSREAEAACNKDKGMVDLQQKDFAKQESDIEKLQSSSLEANKDELSNGMYFEATKHIYMRVISDQDAFVYLSTLMHEFLHHYSSSGSNLPTFINEGITDYLTYKNFGLSDYEIARVSGYSREVQVIIALLEKIPEAELLDSYFSNNLDLFEKTFLKYFPNSDYATFLDKGDRIFRETFGELAPAEGGILDTPIDNPTVQDIRVLLGLEPTKFYL